MASVHGFGVLLPLSPDRLADSAETDTRDEGRGEEASQEAGGPAGASKRAEDGGDGSRPRVQVSL